MHITEITKALRSAVSLSELQVGFRTEDVSARSMHAWGSMALILAKVYTETIRLVGRWRSNEMMLYLHTSTNTFIEGMVARMVQNRYYALNTPANGDYQHHYKSLGL